jgi:predicted DNA-binding transcriptional regulator AlpA
MTGWRWENDPELNFPKPYYIGRFKYFAEDELEAWERSLPRSRQTAEAAA